MPAVLRLYRSSLLLTLLLTTALSLAACNLTADTDATPTPSGVTPTVAGRPSVSITSPRQGELVQLSSELLVSASASDAAGITRVQLFANDDLVKSVLSQNADGDTETNVVLDYTPGSLGELRLRVVAYRGTLASDPAEVTVQVVSAGSLPTITPGGPTPIPTLDTSDPTCRARININLNLRSGPSTDFDSLLVMPAGAVVPIVGRVGDNSWWQMQYGGTTGWASAAFTSTIGANCAFIPIVQPPASPTPQVSITPLLTATFTLTATPPPATDAPSATPGLPDLIVSAFSGPDTLTLPGQGSARGTFNITVRNDGSADTGAFSGRVRVIPNGPESVFSVSGLRRGESAAFQLELSFDTTGSFTAFAEVDFDNAINESNKANNNAQRPLVVVRTPPDSSN